MKSNYKRLGDYIQQVDERNFEDKRFELLGVSVEKRFIKSIANTVGTDWRGYKKISRGQFCYISDTSRRGDKIGIALLKKQNIALVSQAYTVFKIIKLNYLLPEYLELWYKRTEFDRYARFHSHGSVREIFDWDAMCNVMLPIPPIAEQQKIVDAYNVIENRIALKRKINNNLAAMADAIFLEMFADTISTKTVSFLDVINLLGGGTPKTDIADYWNGTIPFFTPKDAGDSIFCIMTEKHLTENGIAHCSSKLYPQFTTFVTCRGTVGNISMAGVPMEMNQSCYALNGKNGYGPFFVYTFTRYVLSTMKKKAVGAVFSALVTKDFAMEQVFLPDIDIANRFENKTTPIFTEILNSSMEIESLVSMKTMLLTTISSR